VASIKVQGTNGGSCAQNLALFGEPDFLCRGRTDRGGSPCGYYLWPQEIDAHPYACLPRPEFVRGHLTLPYTDGYAVAQVASYDDELEAFLYFQFLRGRTASEGLRILLTAVQTRPDRHIASLLLRRTIFL